MVFVWQRVPVSVPVLCVLVLCCAGGVGSGVVEVLLVLPAQEGANNATEWASLLAVQDVNADSGTLPNDVLQVVPKHLECSAVATIEALLGFKEKCSATTSSEFCGRVVISGGCTKHSEIISRLSATFNLIQINHLPLGPTLGKSLAGDNFFSLVETIEQFLFAQFSILEGFGVKEATVIIEREPSCLDGWERLANKTESLFGIRSSVLFVTDRFNTTLTMAFLQESRLPRSVIVCSEQNTLQLIACEAAKRNMVYPSHLWSLPNWTPSQWWLSDNRDCSAAQTRRFIDRAVAVTPDYSGWTPQATNSTRLYNDGLDVRQRSGARQLSSVPEQLAYDSVWTVAGAVHGAARSPAHFYSSSSSSSHNDTFAASSRVPSGTDQAAGAVVSALRQELWQRSFIGTSGVVNFVNMTGQRQYYGMAVTVYTLSSDGDVTVTLLAGVSGSPGTAAQLDFVAEWIPLFYNGVPALPPIPPAWYFEVPRKSLAVYSVAVALSALGAIFAAVCILFSLCFLNDSEIKLTSPKLNVFLGLGTMCWYLTIVVGWPPWPQLPVYLTVHCELHKWLLSLGATLLLMPLLLKTWRIYYIFHNPLKRKIAFQDWKLMIVLAVVVLIDVFCLTVTSVVDRWRLTATVNNGDVNCGSDEAFLVNYILFAMFNSFYCLVGVILACQTRKIRLRGIKESSQVSLALYLFAFALVSYVVAAYLTRSQQLLQLGVVGTLLFATATAILCVIFLPKFYRIVRRRHNVTDGGGEEATAGLPSFDCPEGLDGLRKATLAAMESELQQLRRELQECRNNMRRVSMASMSTRRQSGARECPLVVHLESTTSMSISED